MRYTVGRMDGASRNGSFRGNVALTALAAVPGDVPQDACSELRRRSLPLRRANVGSEHTPIGSSTPRSKVYGAFNEAGRGVVSATTASSGRRRIGR